MDYEREVDSDLSVFHRIDNPDALSGSRYFRLAEFLPSYGGAVAHSMTRDLVETQSREVEEVALPEVSPSIKDDVAHLAAKSQNSQGFPGIEYTGG